MIITTIINLDGLVSSSLMTVVTKKTLNPGMNLFLNSNILNKAVLSVKRNNAESKA